MFAPRPELDRNAEFSWPSTLPGQGGCQPGTYTGTFSCSLVATPQSGLPPPPDGNAFMVTGPVTLQFERSMNGEFLELADAKLEGAASGLIGFTAGLDGRLDCTTFEFTAETTGGTFGLGLPIGIVLGTFGGTLGGSLNPGSLLLSGEWSLAADAMAGLGACQGPWMATFTP